MTLPRTMLLDHVPYKKISLDFEKNLRQLLRALLKSIPWVSQATRLPSLTPALLLNSL